MTHTRETVLARISEAPVRFAEMAGSKAHRARVGLRAIVDALESEGLIRLAYIGGFPHYVLADWEPSPEDVLAEIEGNCRRTMDGCLEWAGYVDPKRGPMVRCGASTVPTSVRRVVWGLKRKPLNFQDTIKPACGNWACVEYGHMQKASRADARRGSPLTLLHKARIATAQRKGAKLTMEIARQIRASADSESLEAAKWGVTKATVSAIRRNEIWQEYQQGMFTGLLARKKVA